MPSLFSLFPCARVRSNSRCALSNRGGATSPRAAASRGRHRSLWVSSPPKSPPLAAELAWAILLAVGQAYAKTTPPPRITWRPTQIRRRG